MVVSGGAPRVGVALPLKTRKYRGSCYQIGNRRARLRLVCAMLSPVAGMVPTAKRKPKQGNDNMSGNMNPLTVNLPESLAAEFDTFADSVRSLAISGLALAQALQDEGVLFAHTSRPGKTASPEHRYGYALFTRLGIHKLSRTMGVAESAFAPVYNGSVESSGTVTIGETTKTAREWKGEVSKTLRPVRTALGRVLSDQIAAAKAEAAFAETARREAAEEAGKAESILEAVKVEAAKAEAEAAKAEAAIEEAPRGKKAAAKAVAKRLEAKAQALAAQVAKAQETADDAQDLELACADEVRTMRDRLARLEVDAGVKRKSTQSPKTDAEKWHAALRKTLGDIKGAVSPTGDADVPAAVRHIEAAIAALNVTVVDH